LGTWPDLQHKFEQIVRLVLFLPQPATTPRLVSLVEDNGAKPALNQVLTFIRVVEDQSGGYDGNAERAADNILGTARLDDVALWISSHFLR
jgi:hypothetical protein